jgi:hypothetical protein
MKVIITALVLMLVLPCYCYPASLEEDIDGIMYLYDEEEYDFEVDQTDLCRRWEALLIIGFVGILRDCILFPKPDSCSLNQLAVMIGFYDYYVRCLPREPVP